MAKDGSENLDLKSRMKATERVPRLIITWLAMAFAIEGGALPVVIFKVMEVYYPELIKRTPLFFIQSLILIFTFVFGGCFGMGSIGVMLFFKGQTWPAIQSKTRHLMIGQKMRKSGENKIF